MINIAVHRHLDTAGQCLEDAFNLVVFIVATGLDVQIHQGGIAQTLEEMEKHFGWHAANVFAMELGIPNQPGAASEIEHHLTETVVHRQGEAVALNAALVTESLTQTFSQSQSGVFDGVVLVYLQIAAYLNIQIELSVAGYLLEHVIEETDAGINMATAMTVEIDAHPDIGLGSGAGYLGNALTGKKQFGNLIPAVDVGDGRIPE